LQFVGGKDTDLGVDDLTYNIKAAAAAEFICREKKHTCKYKCKT